MKIKLFEKKLIKLDIQFFFLICFLEFLIISNICLCSNSLKTVGSTNLSKSDSKDDNKINSVIKTSDANNNKNDESHTVILKPLKNKKSTKKLKKIKKNKQKKNKQKKNHIKKLSKISNNNKNNTIKGIKLHRKKKSSNKFLKKYKMQKKITAEMNKLSALGKLIKKEKKNIKKVLKKNKTLSVIKSCGLKLLTEIYCQFYKKNYSENLEECRKIKYEDFARNCSNRKSVYIIYNLKSATNGYESYRDKSSAFESLSSVTNIQIAVRNLIYKSLFNQMLGPIQKCSEIPIEVRLGIIKQRRRFTYNDKHLNGKQLKDRYNAFTQLFDKIKTLFSDLTNDLIGIKPREQNIVCVGIEKAAERIVNHFTIQK